MTAKFEPAIKEITITLQVGFNYDEYYLTASEPVTTDIAVRQTIHYLEENVCDDYINRDSDMDIEVIILKGQTTAAYKVSTGNDSCTTTSLTFSKDVVTPWVGKTINGAVYRISGNWLL